MAGQNIHLIGEAGDHYDLATQMKSVVRVKEVNDLYALHAVSVELDHVRYQAMLDEAARTKKMPDMEHLKLYRLVINYAIKNNIPLIAADFLGYPEHAEVLALERRVEEDIKKEAEAGVLSEEAAIEEIDDLRTPYLKAHEVLNQKRELYTINRLDDYLKKHPEHKNIAHVGGFKHIHKLRSALEELGYCIKSLFTCI